jgi:hypothetical protein
LAPIHTKIILYTDDTSIKVTSPNLENFETKIDKLFGDINKWFEVKGKGHPITGHEGPTGGVEVELYSFSTSALGGGGWSAPRPSCFTPGKYPVPIVQEAGWAPGPVWMCAKNLAPTGIRSPDRNCLK